MNKQGLRFVFFGSSRFSTFVLDELKQAGYSPVLNITSAREDLPVEKLRELGADLFIVASFGKILPRELIEMPKYGSLNVHPSLLPKLRGPAPIQATIRGLDEPAITIIKMDEKMDHGPIVAQEKVSIEPWPDHYEVVEEKFSRAGGELLVSVLSNLECLREAKPQDDSKATYTKLVKKEDGLLDLGDQATVNLRKVLAYSTWPGAHLFFTTKHGKRMRVVILDAKVEDGQFLPTRVIPEGRKEMDWKSFLRGNA